MKSTILEISLEKEHKFSNNLLKAYKNKEISRRLFLRNMSLLGVNACTIYALAGISASTNKVNAATRGGNFRIASRVVEIKDPATVANLEDALFLSNVCSYLVYTSKNGIVLPKLAKSWKPNSDLTEWTFNFRKNVKWHNGDYFTASDFYYNIERWINSSKSVNKSIFQNLIKIENMGEYKVKLIFSKGDIAIPEYFYNYPMAMVHKSYVSGDIWMKNPIGTGPFRLKYYDIGNKATLEANTDYFEGSPILNKITVYDFNGNEKKSALAIVNNNIDTISQISNKSIPFFSKIPHLNVKSVPSADCDVIRMNVSNAPYSNRNVRKAIQLCVDPNEYLQKVLNGRGHIGCHSHISKVHPEYPGSYKVIKDIRRAKELLDEEGYSNGLKLKIHVIDSKENSIQLKMAELLKKNVAKAGIYLKIQKVPRVEFWKNWLKYPFAITNWLHRPLGVMCWNLAYKSNVAWNETSYSNIEFDRLLAECNKEVNPLKRAKIAKKCKKILVEDAIIIQPVFKDSTTVVNSNIRNYYKHPQGYMPFDEVYFK